MPDTMIQTEITPAFPASCGVMDGFRSPLIGQLVTARAKATSEIKRVVKDKTADIPNKNGGRGYAYSYADLAGVMEAVEDALAAQELALFQTTQERNGKVFLITTLAHSSDQWISSEIRITSPDAGPQVFGSSLTYGRRYSALAILGIAPDTDDDGKAAQERADQQARQKPPQRVEPPRRTDHTPKQLEAIQHRPSEPQRIPFPADANRDTIGEWLESASSAMEGQPEPWRRAWLEMNQGEVEGLRKISAKLADRVEAAAIAPDMEGDAA